MKLEDFYDTLAQWCDMGSQEDDYGPCVPLFILGVLLILVAIFAFTLMMVI